MYNSICNQLSLATLNAHCSSQQRLGHDTGTVVVVAHQQWRWWCPAEVAFVVVVVAKLRTVHRAETARRMIVGKLPVASLYRPSLLAT